MSSILSVLSARRTDDAAPARPRPRTGQLPLPAAVASLTPNDCPELAAVHAFADQLAEFPVDRWLSAGHALISDDAAAERSRACARVTALVSERGLLLAAWYARDAIQTSAQLACSARHAWTRGDRRAFAAAHAAAEDAALALLVSHALEPRDAELLTRPLTWRPVRAVV